MPLLISWVCELCMQNLLQLHNFTVMKKVFSTNKKKKTQMESNIDRVDKFDNNILLKCYINNILA